MRIKVSDVMHILKNTTHSAFPIVDTKCNDNDPDMHSFGRLRGLIRRNDIISMIYMKIFVNWKDIPENDEHIFNKTVRSRETMVEKVQTFYRSSMDFNIPKTRPIPSGHDESFDKLKELYPRYPNVEDLNISLDDQNRYMLDFSLAMDAAPPRVSSGMGYPQVTEILFYS